VQSSILFGSRVRAAALETLAATSKPLTAYRVAKVIGAEPIQVLTSLKALEPEIVRHSGEGWVMVNDLLRLFLREQLGRAEAQRRSEKDELLVQLRMRPRRARESD
jgi:hypothetical protein